MRDNTEEKISYQKTLSALFASFSMLSFGALSLLNNFSMDYYSILFMLSIVIPASLSMGFIGFVIGKMFDQGENFNPNPFKKEKSKHSEYADKLGVVEATNNLLTSNILNLFAIQSIGIIVYTLFG